MSRLPGGEPNKEAQQAGFLPMAPALTIRIPAVKIHMVAVGMGSTLITQAFMTLAHLLNTLTKTRQWASCPQKK